jgi:hypothetical protein
MWEISMEGSHRRNDRYQQTVRKILGTSFTEVGPSILCTTLHWRIIQVLSPEFLVKSLCYPIHPAP